MAPASNKDEEPSVAAVGKKPLRKRPLPDSMANNDSTSEAPRKKAPQVSTELLQLCLEGVRTELKDVQEKYDMALHEHQSVVEEKDRAILERDQRIAELEQRLYYAEMTKMDQFYGHQAPYFHYADENFGKPELPKQQEVPRLFSRRGR